MKILKLYLAILSACMFCTVQAHAVTLLIGDQDGFGYGDANGFLGSDGGPAERTGDRRILDMGDLLPDRNEDGAIRFDSLDNFDLRSATEKNDVGNTGTKWTDVSLSVTYDNKPGLADDAVFVFRFTPPAAGDADYGKNHFINLVYADYDEKSMVMVVDGKIVPLLGNEDGGGQDGYIWRAYAQVSWDDIKDGELVVHINATEEPFVAFDYVLLDVIELVISKPNPVSMLHLLLGD